MKINKKLLIITSIIILLPILFGIWQWDVLPNEIATHWNINNEPDRYSSKAFAVFGLPIIMLLIHLLCIFGTRYDPKRENHSDKILNIVLWICPIISIIMSIIIYAAALKINVNVGMITTIMMGFIFSWIGNYLPKCKQNYTIGIKIPWTLNDETNWYKTHKLAGVLWSIIGFVTIVCGMLEAYLIIIGLIILAIIIPVAYSFTLSNSKKKKE